MHTALEATTLVDGHHLISHSGAIPGFNSVMVGEPASGLGVHLMANAGQAGNAQGELWRLTMRLLWAEDLEAIRR